MISNDFLGVVGGNNINTIPLVHMKPHVDPTCSESNLEGEREGEREFSGKKGIPVKTVLK